MPGSKKIFFMAWFILAAVGAFVVFEDPPAERDWTGYACAMTILPFIFFFIGVLSALLKTALLLPYLVFRSIGDAGAVYRWWLWNSNWQTIKGMLIETNFSCFYIPTEGELRIRREAEKLAEENRSKK